MTCDRFRTMLKTVKIGEVAANILSDFAYYGIIHPGLEWRVLILKRQLVYEKCSQFIKEFIFLTYKMAGPISIKI